MEELTVEEVVRYAVRIEQESFIFYRKASKYLEGNDLKKLTDDLSDQEVDHMNRLKGLLHEDMVTDEKLSSTLNIDTALFDKIIQSGDIPVQATPLNILEIALEREKSTLENYIMLLTISDLNKEIIAVFELLKGMEEQHVKDIWERIEQIRSSQ